MPEGAPGHDGVRDPGGVSAPQGVPVLSREASGAVGAMKGSPIVRRLSRSLAPWVRGVPALRDATLALLAGDELVRAVQRESDDGLLAETEARLRRIASSGKTVLAGPWLSEVGFEVLYWIPFLNWACRRFGIPRERIIVVSRGGVRGWYGSVADRYWDILGEYGPDQFRARNLERAERSGGQKQTSTGEFEQEILARASSRFGLAPKDSEVLHPSMMYGLFDPVWQGRKLVRFLTRRVECPRFDAAAFGDPGTALPREFVAVKFYFSASFPKTAGNVAFIRRVVGLLARSSRVVVLAGGPALDDHEQALAAEGLGSGVTVIPVDAAPADNLRLQSAIVSRARQFVGTYGGFSYVAASLGVPSIGFFSDPSAFVPVHLEIAREAYHRDGFGALTALGTREFDQAAFLFEGGR